MVTRNWDHVVVGRPFGGGRTILIDIQFILEKISLRKSKSSVIFLMLLRNGYYVVVTTRDIVLNFCKSFF